MDEIEIDLSGEDREKLEAIAHAHGLTIEQAFQLAILQFLRKNDSQAYAKARGEADPKVLEIIEKEAQNCPDCGGPRDDIDVYEENGLVHCLCKNCGMHMKIGF